MELVELIFIRNWKALALRGIAGVLFGLVALARPGATLTAVVLMFGAYSLIDGALAIVAGVHSHAVKHAWLLIVEGGVGVCIGLAALSWTSITAMVLVQLIAFWAIVTGAIELASAVRIRQQLPGEFFLGLGGVASVMLGIAILLWPVAGAFVIVALIGANALFFGITLLLLSIRIRRTISRADRPHDDHFDHLGHPRGHGAA